MAANFVPSSVKPSYDPRWFIWTIVFLVVTGISLVSYIVFSDSESTSIDPVVVTKINAPKTPHK